MRHNGAEPSIGSVNTDSVHEYGTKLGLKWKVITLNIRGFGLSIGKDKFRWGKRLICIEKTQFVALQETRLNTVNRNWINSLWNTSDCDFIQKKNIGKSGGQLLIWDTTQFEAVSSVNFESVIGIRGIWRKSGCKLNVINVYSPHDDSKKLKLWDQLSKILEYGDDEAWLLCGDFSEVWEQAERFNCDFIEYRAKRFNKFITDNILLEISLGGRCFTRVSDDGLKFSKLDRFLASEKLCSLWQDLTAVALEREMSDHFPLILKDEEKNFGPKPFKIFDAWFDEEGMEQVVTEAWGKIVAGKFRKDCVFRNKLKNVKEALKQWSTTKYNQLDGEIEVLKNAATSLELKAENGMLNDSDLNLWRDTRKRWLEKEKIKSHMLKQKARIRWSLEGDENTKFFHSLIRRKNNRCNIRGLNINCVWNDSPVDIKSEVFNHFKHIFEETNLERPSLEDLNYLSLSDSEAVDLESPFTEKEIH
ncbi:uncharacterized protein [Rutidosis leptorrhynchoides]|uniref:uncharacterized protein n=1 Tax=Rutidosis leptorrhynchoides TaxID=125765 RepID=UPI003A99BE80